jgi:hypothetical protein
LRQAGRTNLRSHAVRHLVICGPSSVGNSFSPDFPSFCKL